MLMRHNNNHWNSGKQVLCLLFVGTTMFFISVKEPNASGVQLMASLNKAYTIKQAPTLGGKDFVLKQGSPDASFINSMRILFLHRPPLSFSVGWNNEYHQAQLN